MTEETPQATPVPSESTPVSQEISLESIEVAIEGEESPAKDTSLTDRVLAAEKVIREEYQAKFAVEVADFKRELATQNQRLIDAELAKWRKEQQPPTKEEIAQLLSQEYMEFKIEIPIKGEKRTFVLQELPQRQERKFYSMLKEKLIPRLTDLAGTDFKLAADKNLLANLQTVLDTFEPAFDLVTEMCAICLNPRNEEFIVTMKDNERYSRPLDAEWVADNLSSHRIWNIVTAQAEVNRLRDFISSVYRNLNFQKTE